MSEALPKGWSRAALGEVASLELDLVDPAQYPDMPHIAPNHIESRTGRLLPHKTIAEDKVTSPKYRFRAGQILYSKVRPALAKAVLVDFEGLCSADMYPISTRLEPAYLHRWLVSDAFTARVSRAQERTVLPKVNQAALLKLDVPVPPLAEQRRIMARIELLLARSRRAQEALEAVPDLLERFRQAVLREAFRGQLTADWRARHPDVEPASQRLERLRAERRRLWEEAELEKMPARKKNYEEPSPRTQPERPRSEGFAESETRGWTVAPLELLAEPTRGIPYGIVQTGDPHPQGVPTVRCGDLKAFTIELDGLKRVSPGLAEQHPRTCLSGGEVLLAIRGTVGGVAVATPAMRGMNLSREVAMVPPLPGVNSRYLMYLLASPDGVRILAGHTKGVAQSGVNLDDLRRLPVPLAPLAEQEEIVRRVDHALESLSRLTAAWHHAAERMSTLEKALLAKAFRGGLVPQDPNDEPASVLLERLRAERAASARPSPRRARGRDPAG